MKTIQYSEAAMNSNLAGKEVKSYEVKPHPYLIGEMLTMKLSNGSVIDWSWPFEIKKYDNQAESIFLK